jgi:hypothetical protein
MKSPVPMRNYPQMLLEIATVASFSSFFFLYGSGIHINIERGPT